MTAAKTKRATGTETVAWENPLIPNKKLRALYTAMVELRMLEEFVASRRRGSKVASLRLATHGEEGCRVSTAIDLKPDDLTSDATAGVATPFLRGAKLPALLRRDDGSGDAKAGGDTGGILPPIADAVARLNLAMGAAVVMKAKKKGLLIIAYVHRDELALSDWKPILRFAGAQVLPMIFVVQARVAARPGQLSLASSACGVPGIPVDAADPVALYRVAQESTLRARAGGGPVLMECIPFQTAGKRAAPTDPIETMRQFLLHRKIVDEAWLQDVEARFRSRLKSAGG